MGFLLVESRACSAPCEAKTSMDCSRSRPRKSRSGGKRSARGAWFIAASNSSARRCSSSCGFSGFMVSLRPEGRSSREPSWPGPGEKPFSPGQAWNERPSSSKPERPRSARRSRHPCTLPIGAIHGREIIGSASGGPVGRVRPRPRRPRAKRPVRRPIGGFAPRDGLSGAAADPGDIAGGKKGPRGFAQSRPARTRATREQDRRCGPIGRRLEKSPGRCRPRRPRARSSIERRTATHARHRRRRAHAKRRGGLHEGRRRSLSRGVLPSSDLSAVRNPTGSTHTTICTLDTKRVGPFPRKRLNIVVRAATRMLLGDATDGSRPWDGDSGNSGGVLVFGR